MKKYISILCVTLSLCTAAAAQTGDPTEGYFVTPDNVKIFYKIEGRGSETLVAVHGGPGNSLESIRADFEPLAKERRVIYYDQRGQGRSELLSDGTKLGYEKHVADLEALRVHFKLDRMTLIGNSWGGLLISLYAVAHPDRVERMVLDSPASPLKGFIDDMDDEISRRMAKLYKPEQLAHTRAIGRPDAWLGQGPSADMSRILHDRAEDLHVFADVRRQLQGRPLCRRARVRSAAADNACPRLAKPQRL